MYSGEFTPERGYVETARDSALDAAYRAGRDFAHRVLSGLASAHGYSDADGQPYSDDELTDAFWGGYEAALESDHWARYG